VLNELWYSIVVGSDRLDVPAVQQAASTENSMPLTTGASDLSLDGLPTRKDGTSIDLVGIAEAP
jgi:hypothetical protein